MIDQIEILARVQTQIESLEYAINYFNGKMDNGDLKEKEEIEFYQLGIKHMGEAAITHLERVLKGLTRTLEVANGPKPNKDIQPA